MEHQIGCMNYNRNFQNPFKKPSLTYKKQGDTILI